LPIIGIVVVLAGSNLLVHLEALGLTATGSLGLRLGLADVASLITLVGGPLVRPAWRLNAGSQRRPQKKPATKKTTNTNGVASYSAA
jgi:hypothetical protein